MQSRLIYILAILLQIVATLPLLAQVEGVEVSASSHWDTTWSAGVGPRLSPSLCLKSAQEPPIKRQNHPPSHTLDGQNETAWLTEGSGINEWIQMDLASARFLESLSLKPARAQSGGPVSEIARLSVSGYNAHADQPQRQLQLEPGAKSAQVDLMGRSYASLNLTIEALHPGGGSHAGLAEIQLKSLPLSPEAVFKTLELPESATLMALRGPGGGSQYIIAWSARVGSKRLAELVGMDGPADNPRVRWKTPISLQHLGSANLAIEMERVNFGGPPSLLVKLDFIDEFVSMRFARIYTLNSQGAIPAWEGRLSALDHKSHLSFAPNRLILTSEVEDLGYRLRQSTFQFDPRYGQFKPGSDRISGLRASGQSKGQRTASPMPLFDGDATRPWTVSGSGEGTELTLAFDSPRRIAAIQLQPRAQSPTTGQATSPRDVTLIWPDGYAIEANLDNSTELQTIYEGWDGPGAQSTTTLKLRIDSVHGGIPGQEMKVGAMEIFFLDPP